MKKIKFNSTKSGCINPKKERGQKTAGLTNGAIVESAKPITTNQFSQSMILLSQPDLFFAGGGVSWIVLSGASSVN
jgi:hypothetical protein